MRRESKPVAMTMLELDGVVKRYRNGGEEVCAVDGVSLELAPGEMVALHGPSGSGKTTLLLLIAALLAPDEGTIRFEGRDLTRMSESEASEYLHRDVGFIYQTPQLMPRVSAIENAALKLMLGGAGQREAQERAHSYLQRVGMADRLQRPPERLSAGERQRVAIARALAGEPRLILADEPTGTLDSARSREIVRLLHSIAHEHASAVLLVTHDPEAAGVADRSCTLRDGRLLAHTGAYGSAQEAPPPEPHAEMRSNGSSVAARPVAPLHRPPSPDAPATRRG